MDIGTLGGILNIIAAITMYRGHVYTSTIIYLVTDICWIILSLSSGDILGAILIAVGFTLGVLTFAKMELGEFVKNLHQKA